MQPHFFFVALVAVGCSSVPSPTVSQSVAQPVSLDASDMAGVWLDLHGCPAGELHLNRDGTYQHFCFDTIRSGKWTFRAGNTLVLKHDVPDERKRTTKDLETITVSRVERLSDRTFIYLRFQDGHVEKYMNGA